MTQSDVVMGSFVTGTYGNGTSVLPPANAAISYYYALYADGNITVQQVYVNSNGDEIINPVFSLAIPSESATVGEHTFSYSGNTPVQIKLADYNSDFTEITCYHALGEGAINISNIGNFTDHGPLGFTGDITLYSPKNYKNYGDISSQLNYPACDPVE